MVIAATAKGVTGYVLMVLGAIVFMLGAIAAFRKVLHEQVKVAKGESQEQAIELPPGIWPVIGALITKGGIPGTLMGLGIAVFLAGAILEGWAVLPKSK